MSWQKHKNNLLIIIKEQCRKQIPHSPKSCIYVYGHENIGDGDGDSKSKRKSNNGVTATAPKINNEGDDGFYKGRP